MAEVRTEGNPLAVKAQESVMIADRCDPTASARLPAAAVTASTDHTKPAAEPERAVTGIPPGSLKPTSAPAVMPPQLGRQAPAASRATWPPAARQTRVADAASAQIAARSTDRAGNMAEARAAVSDPSRFAPPPRVAALLRPKGSAPEPKAEGRELAGAAPFGVGYERGAGPWDEETPAQEHPQRWCFTARTKVSRPRFLMNSRHPSHPHGCLGLFIRGAVLAVVLTAGVTYLMLRSESSLTTPPLVAAEAKVVPADEDEQNKPTKKSVDGAQPPTRRNLCRPALAK